MAGFNFQSLLGVVKAVASNPSVQSSGTALFTGLASQLVANANNPEAVKKIANELQQGAPALVGAIVSGTPAQGMVDPSIVHK
jgi:hypothetical protein